MIRPSCRSITSSRANRFGDNHPNGDLHAGGHPHREGRRGGYRLGRVPARRLHHGSFTWISGSTTVRSPIAIQPVTIVGPTFVGGTGTYGSTDVIAAAVEGPVTASVPGSVIQLHPHVTVIVDEAAASTLAGIDYSRYGQTSPGGSSWRPLLFFAGGPDLGDPPVVVEQHRICGVTRREIAEAVPVAEGGRGCRRQGPDGVLR